MVECLQVHLQVLKENKEKVVMESLEGKVKKTGVAVCSTIQQDQRRDTLVIKSLKDQLQSNSVS